MLAGPSAMLRAETKPLVDRYTRDLAHRGPFKDYSVRGAPFIRIVQKADWLRYINVHWGESRRLLIDEREPQKQLTEKLTAYQEVLLSPDGKRIAFLDYKASPLSYRVNVYDLDNRVTKVVFDTGQDIPQDSSGQVNYFSWLADGSLFVQYEEIQTRPPDQPAGINIIDKFVLLDGDGKTLLGKAIPAVVPITDASALAYSYDNKTYLRYNRSIGEKPWFICDEEVGFKKYHPPSGVIMVRRTPEGVREKLLPCDDVCVEKAGWEMLPRLLGCHLLNGP